MQTYPLIYKTIPTQYVFLIQDDGLVKIQIVRDIPAQIKLPNLKEAKAYVKNFKQNV